MKRREAAGTLLYRLLDAATEADAAPLAGGAPPVATPPGLASRVEVLIVHPSGNYNRRAPWSIPKGLVDDGEELEAAARRETLEETGIAPGPLTSLGFVDYQKSRKRVHAFAGPLPQTPGGAHVAPRCASWEIDRAELVSIAEAAKRLHRDQHPFLERLTAMLTGSAVP